MRALVVRAIALLAACLLTACADGASPKPRVQLDLSGAIKPTLFHSRNPDRTWSVQCFTPLTAQLTGQSGVSIVWDGATFTGTLISNGAPSVTSTLGATALADFWGAGSLDAGQSQDGFFTATAQEPFAGHLEFRYHESGSKVARSATFDFRCEPISPALKGRWVLSTINDVRMPGYGVAGDTLEFFANLTYTTKGGFGPESPYGGTTGPEPYDFVRSDAVLLRTLIFGVGTQDSTIQSGTTLTYVQRNCCGRIDQVWRFDLIGSNPVLPPPPTLVASPTSVTFTVLSGAAPPAAQTVQITASNSAGGAQIPNLEAFTNSGCTPPAPCGTWLQWGLAGINTPATLQLSVFNTALSPGTYLVTAFVKTNAAQNSPLAIPVTLVVTP